MKKTVGIMIIGLLAVVAVTAYLNRGVVAEKEEVQEKAILTIKKEGKEMNTMDMEQIKLLGSVEFDADLKASGKEAENHQYTGALLKNIFDACDIAIHEENQVVVKAVDGYTVALTGKEVLEEDHVYLSYAMDGEPLGKKEDGGKGPYQVILRKDPFSQRWCKFVVELEVQ